MSALTLEEKARFTDAPKNHGVQEEKTDEEKKDTCESFEQTAALCHGSARRRARG
jgi:hypothetical protein